MLLLTVHEPAAAQPPASKHRACAESQGAAGCRPHPGRNPQETEASTGTMPPKYRAQARRGEAVKDTKAAGPGVNKEQSCMRADSRGGLLQGDFFFFFKAKGQLESTKN